MENIKINPSLSTEAKYAQSGLSVMDFNINEICKRLTIFMNACQESKAVEKAVECSVISYSLDRQMMIDDVIQQIQELLSLTVLLAVKSKDGSSMECVAYTKPTLGNMAVVHLYSSMHGCLESFFINVYDSAEIMYEALHKRLERLQSEQDVVIMESVNPIQLIKDFH